MNEEAKRLEKPKDAHYPLGVFPWDKWGPYVSERGWGSVREDYSENGDPWNYFPHDHARKRAFRRCEDGIAGISDRFQVLLFAPAFWNGKDPIIKERLFGLNCFEGNHGEDVKEYYYHLDATPTHSYMKYLYKYPQEAYPYQDLVEENARRSAKEREYELIDTKIFDENRYFDIYIEYAKQDPEDLCIKIEAFNRADTAAPLHILPHLWFRNQWSWGAERQKEPQITHHKSSFPCLLADDSKILPPKYLVQDYHLGPRYLYGSKGGKAIFTNNETNNEEIFGTPNDTPYVKDAFDRYLVNDQKDAINPDQIGTKAALHYYFEAVEPGKSVTIELRFSPKPLDDPLKDVQKIIDLRKKEADIFYDSIHPKHLTEDEKKIQRQALSGMIWNKQIYIFEVTMWLKGDNPLKPPPESHKWIRNVHWGHIVSYRVLSMPDKWEFPWFAAWDLTFHALTFAIVDLDFAKLQLWLLLFDQFQHPNGAIPAYEWEFSDVNPPVQALAVLKLFEYEKKKFGREDYHFLEKCFHKLLLNFSWWVNKVDSLGNNVFEGGFLGMDNIGFYDRTQQMELGFMIDQSDGAGWISLLCLNLMRIALTLAQKNPIYESLGTKFFQHFVYVTAAMRKGYWRSYDMWNEKDGFFYTHIRYHDGRTEEVPVRSLVGVIPFFACDVWDETELKKFPEFYSSYQWFVAKQAKLSSKVIQTVPGDDGNHHIFGLLSTEEIEKFLKYIWDPNEFRSEYGLRSVSKYHEENPVIRHGVTLSYQPGEALEKIKGGNSNWRGPIWVPMNYLLIETLTRLGNVYGNHLKIKVGDEKEVTLKEMANSFRQRMLNIFKTNEDGKRPCFGDYEKIQTDPHFKDHLFFHEHFHADTGRGLGASRQNGWTGLIANLIEDLEK